MVNSLSKFKDQPLIQVIDTILLEDIMYNHYQKLQDSKDQDELLKLKEKNSNIGSVKEYALWVKVHGELIVLLFLIIHFKLMMMFLSNLQVQE